MVIRPSIDSRGTGTFIVVKAARVLGGALSGIRFDVPFHQHWECGEDIDVSIINPRLRALKSNLISICSEVCELRLDSLSLLTSRHCIGTLYHCFTSREQHYPGHDYLVPVRTPS